MRFKLHSVVRLIKDIAFEDPQVLITRGMPGQIVKVILGTELYEILFKHGKLKLIMPVADEHLELISEPKNDKPADTST